MFPYPVDPVTTPRAALEHMLSANAFRIADLLSQLETSSRELSKLRTRALKADARSRAGKPARSRVPRSPRKNARARRPLAPSPTTVRPAPVLSRGHWSPDEEARFEDGARRYGATAYAQISAFVATRTEKQVRDHAWRQRQKAARTSNVSPSIAAAFAALDIPAKSVVAKRQAAVIADPTCNAALLERPPSQRPVIENTMPAPTPPPPLCEAAIESCSSPLSCAASSPLCAPVGAPHSPLSAVSTELCNVFDTPLAPNGALPIGASFAGKTRDIASDIDGFEFDVPFGDRRVASGAFEWGCGGVDADFSDRFLLLEHA